MGKSITEEELAVKAGYWFNFRFNPELAKAGKPAFTLDSKAPTESYQDFIAGEVRYSSLMRANPTRAKELFARSEQECKERFEYLQKLVDLYKAQ
jgi:pyruvate-ferredoxin/flavodoxin oxidoreductase